VHLTPLPLLRCPWRPGRSRRGLAVVLPAALILAWQALCGQAAAFAPVAEDPFLLASDQSLGSPAVAVDRQGFSHIVWTSGKQAFYMKVSEGLRYAYGATLLDPNLPGASPSFPVEPKPLVVFDAMQALLARVATDSAGNAHMVVWSQGSAFSGVVYIKVGADGTKAIHKLLRLPQVSGDVQYSWPAIAIDPTTDLPVVIAIVQVTNETPASFDLVQMMPGLGILSFLSLYPIFTPALTTCSEYVMGFRLDAAGEIASRHVFSSERQNGGPPYRSEVPSLAVDSLGRLHAVWRYRAPGAASPGIVYCNSDGVSDAGSGLLTLSASVPADGVDSMTRPMVVAGPGDALHVAWHTATGRCAYTGLSRDGAVTIADMVSSDRALVTGSPALAAGDDGLVRFVWEDARQGADEIYFSALRTDTSALLTYGTQDGDIDYRLTVSQGEAFSPAIGVSPWGQPSIIWKDTAYGSYALAKYRPPWTCLIFLNGDNNLYTSYVQKISGWPDFAPTFLGLEEMAYLPFARLVVQFDGAGIGDTRRLLIGYDGNSSENYAALRSRYLKHLGHAYWYVGPDGASTDPGVNSERDMADPAVLTDFLRWGTTQFPAPRLMLAVVNHGSGWLPGKGAGARDGGTRAISYDDGGTPTNPNDDSSMGMGRLRQALANGGNPFHLDVLYFDACLMGMLEVAYEVQDYADYLVCSQAVSWANPHSYVLDLRTDTTPRDLAKSISDRYRDWCLAAKVGHHTTAVIRCSAVEGFSNILDQLVEPSHGLMTSPQLKRAYLKAWAESQHTDDDGRYTDIYSFCSYLQKELQKVTGGQALADRAQQVMSALDPAGDDRLVVTNLHDNGPMRDCHGLSIYFPFTRPDLVLAGCTEAEEESTGAFFGAAPPASRAVDEGGYGAVIIRFPAEQSEGTVTLSRSNTALDIYQRSADTQIDPPSRADTYTPVLAGGQLSKSWNLAVQEERDALAELRDKLVAKGLRQDVTWITLTYTRPGASSPAFSDKAKATIVHLDLDIDADNDGDTDADDEALENTAPGKIIAVNNDNDDDENNDGLDQADEIDNRDTVVDGDADENDMAALVLTLDAAGLPPAFKVSLGVSDKQMVRIFDASTPRVSIVGPTTTADQAAGAASWETTLGALGLTKPLTFLVEGVLPGQVTITLALKTDKGEPIARKTVVATVVKVDLEIARLAETDEEKPGCLLLLNNDDDNDGKQQDLTEAAAVNGENDLLAVKLKFEPATLAVGVLRLETAAPTPAGTGAIKAWSAATKGVQTVLPAEWRVGAAPAAPATLYIEGTALATAPGDLHLTLAYVLGKSRGEDIVSLTVARVELEPITIRPANGGTFPLYNPCGIETGKTAKYEIAVEPASIPDDWIEWKKAGGSITVEGTAKGRLVTIKGDAAGTAKAEVEIKGNLGPKPAIDIEVLDAKKAKVFAYIVRKDDGTEPAWTEAEVDAFLGQVNQVYAQVAMTFERQGAVSFVDKTDWLDIAAASDYAEMGLLGATHSHTGGLEMYFVKSIEDANGLNWSPAAAGAGCLVAKHGNFRTAAHELGHACGLDDIYIQKGAVRCDDSIVQPAWLPGDWNNGTGAQYYAGTLQLRDLIQRLLMYGVGNNFKADIAHGTVMGLDVNAAWAQVPVGFQNLTRENPQHW
jgi:hypothetical protein